MAISPQPGLRHAVWREQLVRGFDRLTLEQMGRLETLLLKMGWPNVGRDVPHETVISKLTDDEQIELRQIEADMAPKESADA